MMMAFERVGEEGAAALENDLLELMRDEQIAPAMRRSSRRPSTSRSSPSAR